MRTISFAKAHASLNDFIVMVDRHATTPLSREDVRLLCDRHAGIGADGVLRAVKAEHIAEWEGDPALWFMDHRNADGSPSRMSANGACVLVRHLADHDWVTAADVPLATRAGLRQVHLHTDGSVSTQVGDVTMRTEPVEIIAAGRRWSATSVEVDNPHAVVLVAPDEDLAALDLTTEPAWSPAEAFPEGVDVVFAQVLGPQRVRLRAHQRGVGEARSCGTGAVAAAAVAGQAEGCHRVEFPGGVLQVQFTEDGARVKGRTTIVGRGEVQLPDPVDSQRG